MCLTEKGFHMLIDCIKSQELWLNVEAWIQSLGMTEFRK